MNDKIMEKEVINTLNLLRNFSSAEELASFDIKKLFEKDIIEYTNDKMNKFSIQPCNLEDMTPLKQMCCYKISAGDLQIDCDVSLFSIIIYVLGFDIKGTIKQQNYYNKNFKKYYIKSNNLIYAGDTMNSYATITRLYIKKFNKNNNIYKEENGVIKYTINGHIPYLKSKYINFSTNNGKEPNKMNDCSWEVCILDKNNYDYFDSLLPEYIKKFLNICHTIGNIIPVPMGCFNIPRNNKVSDYWDLTLKGIKENNFKSIIGPTKIGKNAIDDSLKNIEKCEKWYKDEYNNDFNLFVKNTYMQPFVDENLNPIKLCEKEILKDKNIKSDDEYKRFYENVNSMIVKRGLLIANKVVDVLSKKTNEEILKEYFEV